MPHETTPPPFRLHHTGIVVADIDIAAKAYSRRFGYECKSEVIRDEVQHAFVQFFRLPGDLAYLEFVCPDRPDSKLRTFLERGGGIHHLCYATLDLARAIELLRTEGLSLVRKPAPSVAFDGRHIAWMMGRDRILIELAEEGPAGRIRA